MSARLYPGWGTGRGSYEGHFKVKSFTAAGHPEYESGDKMILPTSALKEINRLKLPFPLTFKVVNERIKTAGTVPDKSGKLPCPPPDQYAGVTEFSAPEGEAFLPTWMIQNLKLREGGSVQVNTVRDLPPGTFIKIRPHDNAFVELAASFGPRELLESAFRNYSVLSAGERIMIDFAGDKYYMDILEVKPGKAISIYGNLDLEVDFAPVLGSPEDLLASPPLKEPVAGPTSTPMKSKSGVSTEKAALSATGTSIKKKPSSLPSPAKSLASAPSLGSTVAKTSTQNVSSAVLPVSAEKQSPKKSTSLPSSAAPASVATVAPPRDVSSGSFDDMPMFAEEDELAAAQLTPLPSFDPKSFYSRLLPEETGSTAAEPSEEAEASLEELNNRFASLGMGRSLSEGVSSAASINEGDSHVEGLLSALAHTRLERARSRSNSLGFNSLGTNSMGVEGPTATALLWRPQSRGEQKEADADAEAMGPPCDHCGAYIPPAAMEMHRLRCSRNAAYHRSRCETCGITIFKKELEESHFHCGACSALMPVATEQEGESRREAAQRVHAALCLQRQVTCACGSTFTAAEMQGHLSECAVAKRPCRYCKVPFRSKDLVSHENTCGVRSGECQKCATRLMLKELVAHESQCSGTPAVSVPINSPDSPTPKSTPAVKPIEKEKIPAGLPPIAKKPSSRTMVATDGAKSSPGDGSVAAGISSRSRPPSGGPAAGSGLAALRAAKQKSSSDALPCPHCGSKAADFEMLQVHMLTDCKKSPKS